MDYNPPLNAIITDISIEFFIPTKANIQNKDRAEPAPIILI